MNILIVNGSVREAQATERVTKWVESAASEVLGSEELASVRLKELALPMFDEPMSPMMNSDRHPEGVVQQWLEKLASADAYVFVTPEYNHGMPASLKNAIDYIDYQVMKKPFMVVGHGGVGGARAIEQVKLVLNSNLGGIPIPDSVNVLGFVGYDNAIDENGAATTDGVRKQEETLKTGLKTLHWHAAALKTARDNA